MDSVQYPQVASVWDDNSGIRGHRWTLTTFHVAIVSAVVAILISLAIGRLLAVSNTFIYIIFLYKRTKTVYEDQVITIARNGTSPGTLLYSLSAVVFAYRGKIVMSTVFVVTWLFALSALILQAATIYGVG
jgi:hypothetical protein